MIHMFLLHSTYVSWLIRGTIESLLQLLIQTQFLINVMQIQSHVIESIIFKYKLFWCKVEKSRITNAHVLLN
jgi:hypothetical protein